MNNGEKTIFSFGPYRLDPVERVLSRANESLGLTPKAFDALVLLVENSGHLLEKDLFMQRLWPDTTVEENNLSQCIYVLRRTLNHGTAPDENQYIETVPRRGYRFTANVERISLSPRHEGMTNSDKAEPKPRQRSTRAALLAAGAAAVIFALAFAILSRRLRPASPSADTSSASVAVLPFLNLSDKPQNEYLSDGFTEELTTALAEVHGLRVVARTSAFQFRGKGEDVRKIGNQLNVGAIIEGSLSKTGDKLHVTAQLINARNGYHFWSGEYDGDPKEIYGIEEQIVSQTTRALGISDNGPRASVATRRTENPEAHDLYLEGRYFWYKRDLPDMDKSIELFQAAIRKDHNYALAYLGLADAYVVIAGNGQRPYAQVMPAAGKALSKSLELDPSLPEAHITKAMLLPPFVDQRMKEQEFRRAVELAPGYATAHHWYGVILTSLGRFEEADAELRKAQLLDPLSPMVTEDLAENYYYWRRYDKVVEQVGRIREMGSHVGDPILGLAYIQQGQHQEAITLFRGLSQGGEPGKNLTYLATAYAAAGQAEEARRLLKAAQNSGGGYVPAYMIARAYVFLGEKDEAFGWLQKGYEQPDPTMSLRVDPALDPIRSDPRYTELVRKAGFPN